MKYAKLVNGYPEFAPRRILWEDMQVFNPTAEQLTALGYKPVIFTDSPETEPGYIAEPGWYDEDDALRQVWTIVEEPDEVDADRAMEILFGGEGE